MSRLTQIVRNLFLRLEGLFGVFFKSLFSFIGNIFGFFANIFGFTQSDYFLETDEGQTIKKASSQESIPKTQYTAPDTSRRRPNAKKIDDYYINMARDVKKN